jgi:glutathione S-transferase
MGELQSNPHPFRKIPCLTDDNGSTIVFESGAILEYLQDNYGPSSSTSSSSSSSSAAAALTRSQRGAITSWIVWANASLDPVCFIETPQGKVIDTSFKYGHPRLDQLETYLSDSANQPYILGERFTLADVAVASYLLYVPQFFPNDLKLRTWPSITRYMTTCAARESYGKAFGADVQSFLLTFLDPYVAAEKK